MTLPKFEITPKDRLQTLYVEVVLSIKELAEIQCAGTPSRKIQNALDFINNCFSLKHTLEITYESDEDSAMICDFVTENCGKGKRRTVVNFPVAQTYWSPPHFSKKRLVRFVCWRASTEKPDFNLNIGIAVKTYAHDLFLPNRSESVDSVRMNIYGFLEDE
jgi:hypothetical protein